MKRHQRHEGGETLGFTIAVSQESLHREKEKARALRKSQWWQRQLDKGICHYCGRPVPTKEMTLDHIVPLIRGGRSVRGNVVAACKTCNNRKKYLLPLEWDEYLQSAGSTAQPEEGSDSAGAEGGRKNHEQL
jgi:5-methylcytosine-specific restriction enzyme A